jgi:hypothetical protein
MNNEPNPTSVRGMSWPFRTPPAKSMLHFAPEEYPISRMAASPGSLSTAALATVSLPEQYSDLGQCLYELLSAWGFISQLGFCMETHPSENR